MESEAYVKAFTEYGNPLEITIKLYFYQDESLNTGKLFWTYDILKIKGVVIKRGESFDYDVDGAADYEAKMAMDDQHMTDAEWDDFILEQEAGAWVDAERKAERALDFGYGG